MTKEEKYTSFMSKDRILQNFTSAMKNSIIISIKRLSSDHS